MLSAKISDLIPMNRLRHGLILMVFGATMAASSASYVAVQVGSNAAGVYLRRGQVYLDYEFITRIAQSDEHTGSLSIAVQAPDGTYLFRDSIPGMTGWYHASFFNPADQIVNFWGKGGVHFGGPSGGEGAGRVIDVGTTIRGGDQPPANSVEVPVANPPAPTQAKKNSPEVHAVIISGHRDLSRVVQSPIQLVGSIIALGRQEEASGSWNPGVHIIPDPELLNGSKIPPVTPNLIDVRIVRFDMSARFQNTPADGK